MIKILYALVKKLVINVSEVITKLDSLKYALTTESAKEITNQGNISPFNEVCSYSTLHSRV